MPTERVEFLDVGFDQLSLKQVVEHLDKVEAASPYRYLVTPNVDHMVRLHGSPPEEGLLTLYKDADLCVCDSRILRALAKTKGVELPLAAGSDLTVAILDRLVRPGDRITVIGGDEGLLEDLRTLYPGFEWYYFSPPMGLRSNAAARRQTADFIARTRARFSFIAVGSPQQEMIAHEVRSLAGAGGMALCIGASLEFITGRLRRAPRWMQQLHIEWVYRLLSEPGRMWRRYLVEGPRIFLLTARHSAAHRKKR